MSIPESFFVDHTKMVAPSVRLAKTIRSPGGDLISVFDLRFCKPNIKNMTERGLHTMEHLFSQSMRFYLNNKEIEIIDISPMGCRTGFYMSTIGLLDEEKIICAWKKSMRDVLKIDDLRQIKSVNRYRCGFYKMHSVEEARRIADCILDKDIVISKNSALSLGERSDFS